VKEGRTVERDDVVHVLRKVEHEREAWHEVVDLDMAVSSELVLSVLLARVVGVPERRRVALERRAGAVGDERDRVLGRRLDDLDDVLGRARVQDRAGQASRTVCSCARGAGGSARLRDETTAKGEAERDAPHSL